MQWLKRLIQRFRRKALPAPAYVFISDLKLLPLEAFIRASVYHDFSGTWSGDLTPPDEEIEANWLSIRSDYLSLNGSMHLAHFLRLAAEANALASRISRIQAWLRVGREIVHETVAEVLLESGYIIDSKASDEMWLATLDSIEAMLGPERLRLDRMRDQLPKDGEDQGSAATEEDFENALLEISKFMGYDVDRSVSTYRYCLMAAKLRKHIEALTKPTKGHGRY